MSRNDVATLYLDADETGVSVRVEHRMSATGRVTNNLFITIALAIAVAGLVSAALGDPGSLGAAVLYLVGRGINGFQRWLGEIPADDLMRALGLTKQPSGSDVHSISSAARSGCPGLRMGAADRAVNQVAKPVGL